MESFHAPGVLVRVRVRVCVCARARCVSAAWCQCVHRRVCKEVFGNPTNSRTLQTWRHTVPQPDPLPPPEPAPPKPEKSMPRPRNLCPHGTRRSRFIYMHTFIHTFLHTYIHTYIHIYTYTYIHTHRQASLPAEILNSDFLAVFI